MAVPTEFGEEASVADCWAQIDLLLAYGHDAWSHGEVHT